MNELAIQIQYDDNFEFTLESAAKAGFKYVALGFGSSKCFHNDDWEQHLAKIEKNLNKNSLECIQTHLPYYSLLISAETVDPDMEKAIKRCIEASGKLGARWCAYHPRTAVNFNYSPRKSFELAKEAVAPLISVAQKYKTGIALENLPVFPDIYQMKFYSSDYEDLCELHDCFKDDSVGICWDFGHAHLMKFDEVQAISYVGNRIKATHIHNNSQNDDSHFLPSQGNIEWEKLMPKMGEFYKNALTLEINYKFDPMLDSFLEHSYQCVKYIRDLMNN